ncbi:MAG TPA: ATP synthase F0 subunit B [Candidatus Acidoferrales bacterium]|jgi:F0F1-type ATP synthase membrane subunit b/b'|nr:ATP synthase F0 subunit B [Candidatus Acidoferrales bacterium]
MISRLLRRLSAAILTMVLAGMFAAFPALAADEAANQDPAESPIGAVFKWLNFAVVIGAIGYFVAKKAPPYFRGHADQIASAIESAQAAKAEADRQLREAEAGLARLDTETAAMREALKKEFEDEAQRLRLAGKQEIERIDRAADVEIAAALRLALLDLRELAAQLATARAAALVAQQMTPDRRAMLIQRFVEELPAPVSGEGRVN